MKGLSVWMDDQISPGTRSWAKEIWKHLKACHVFVVVMTPRSLESHWVDCELIIALEQKKKIFPILLEDERWFNVANIQHFDARDGLLPPESFFEEVNLYLSNLHITADNATSLSSSNDDEIASPSIEDSEDSEENEFEISVKERERPPVENLVWAGDWFVNVGEGDYRTWEDCVKYGFISAGQGSVYSNALKNLNVGSTIYAYISGLGYVGQGEVIKQAVPIKEFTVGQENTPLLNVKLRAEKPAENSDNLELSEWVVGVKWLKTFPKQEAHRFVGAFANPNVVCKLRHKRTLDFLRKEFSSENSIGAENGGESEELKIEWIGDWFINVGVGKNQRSWADCQKYGFISAGQSAKLAAAMRKLEVGSTFFAYVGGRGYVGYGRVVEAAVPIKSFTVGSENTPLLDMDLEAEGLAQNSNNLELSEWVARVDWLKTLPKEQALWATGLFAHVGTICRLRDEETLEFLYSKFDISN